MFWLNDIRDKIKADNPGISVTELTKKAGEMWKDVKDRSVWDAKAAKAKETYEKAMKEYTASGGSKTKSSPKESPKEKKEKKATKPSKTPPKVSSSGKSPMKIGDFKSKEYISTDEESSHESEEEKTKKKKTSSKPANKTAAKKSKKKESSEEEEIDSTPASSEVSDDNSD